MQPRPLFVALIALPLALAGCSTTGLDTGRSDLEQHTFEQDRNAILAMAGDYHVTFDFRETVALTEGYELKEPKISTGHEIVRVLEDTGSFISLQHVLIAGGPRPFAIKHWRQDWIHEPARIFEYTGYNAWQNRSVETRKRDGAWAQLVYQVDDSPRYAGLGVWRHDNGTSSWTSNPSWRPLPRRDSTTRDDYDVVVATNRHAITPDGWVHEQDNTKLVLRDSPRALAREVGVNTYKRSDDFETEIGESYLIKTEAYWSAVQQEWSAFEHDHDAFGLTLIGEPEPLYEALLDLAERVRLNKTDLATATQQARTTIQQYTVTDPQSIKPLDTSKVAQAE